MSAVHRSKSEIYQSFPLKEKDLKNLTFDKVITVCRWFFDNRDALGIRKEFDEDPNIKALAMGQAPTWLIIDWNQMDQESNANPLQKLCSLFSSCCMK